jgi:hypothetical protein
MNRLLSTSIGIALLGINGMAWATDGATPTAPAKFTVYVQVVNGLGREDKTDEKMAAAWITEEVKRLGSSRASAHSSWIELSEREQEVYASEEGGRLIKGKATVGANGQLDVEINGFKIGQNRYSVSLKQETGARSVVKLTQYPGERNVYLAFHVGKVDQEGGTPNTAPEDTARKLADPQR